MKRLESIIKNCFKENREMGERTPLLNEFISDGFHEIGTVVNFVLYPIDCGNGFKFGKASFTQNGIQMPSLGEKYTANDRTMIVFNRSTKKALVQPEFTMIDEKHEYSLYCYEQYFKEKIAAVEHLEVVEVDYLGTTITLLCFPAGSHFEIDIEENVFKKHEKNSLRLGYCTEKEREILNKKHRFSESKSHNWNDDMMKKAFLPNYSNYTLINVQTFNAVCTRGDVNYRNFRPQIVVQFKDPFIEKYIDEIKIVSKTDAAKVILFDQIIPCVVEDINYNPKCKNNKFLEVYNRLKSNHTLYNTYPMLAKGKDPVLPVFGINMELKGEPNDKIIIRQEDLVYARYKNPDYQRASTSASTSDSTSASTSASTNAVALSR